MDRLGPPGERKTGQEVAKKRIHHKEPYDGMNLGLHWDRFGPQNAPKTTNKGGQIA